MSLPILQQELYGVDVSDYHVAKLDKEAFLDADFDLFTKERVHYLVYAKQFQTKIPTQGSIKRSQRRAKAKKAKQEEIAKVPIDPKAENTPVPKWDPKNPQDIVLKCARKSCTQNLTKTWIQQIKQSKGMMIEEKPKNRKPVNIVGILNVKKPAVPPKGFTQYQLWPDPKKRKANKSKAKTRRNQKLNVVPQAVEQQSLKYPIYFRKKKQNQKRRKEERRQLIRNNKEKLFQIYGSAIFQRDWKMGRADIQKALGIVKPDLGMEHVSIFVKMVDESLEKSTKTKTK